MYYNYNKEKDLFISFIFSNLFFITKLQSLLFRGREMKKTAEIKSCYKIRISCDKRCCVESHD